MTPFDTLKALRGRYGATMNNQECVALINAVAWTHRAEGWGLSRKPSGNHGTMKNGTPVAVDILINQPQHIAVDCLQAGGEASTPTWSVLAANKYDWNGRPFVSPEDPGVVPNPNPNPNPTPNPNPNPAPSTDLAAVISRINALEVSLTAKHEEQ